MFERFAASFKVSPIDQMAGSPWRDERLSRARGYLEFAARLAGCSFEGGLYRFHDAKSGPRGASLIADAFPAFASRACPFAHDWLGRQFALDAERLEGDEALILLMEPGTAEALEVPLPFAPFHEQLRDLREPALAATFFADWVRANPTSVPLPPEECVGYRVPLFLGGTDGIENLERIDMDVYWSLCGQLRQGARHMAPGNTIRGVSGGA